MPNKKLLQGGGALGSAFGSTTGAGGAEFGSFFKNASPLDFQLIGGQVSSILKGLTKAGDAPKTEGSEVARKITAKGLDAALGVPVGSALDATGKITQSFTRDKYGATKSDFAAVAENINPINLASNLASGDFSGKKQKKEAKFQELKERKSKQALIKKKELPLIARNFSLRNQFAPVFNQKGGKLKLSKVQKLLYAAKGTSLNKNCGCNVNADGIDTDIFKKLQPDEMRIVQIELGTKPNGLYSNTDKQKMKNGAKMNNMSLKDYLMGNNKIKSVIYKLL